MDFVTTLGFVAGALTTASFLPQVVKTWRTRSTRDISLFMFGSFCAGVFLWLVYGILTLDPPIIVANVVTLALAGTVLAFKVRYK